MDGARPQSPGAEMRRDCSTDIRREHEHTVPRLHTSFAQPDSDAERTLPIRAPRPALARRAGRLGEADRRLVASLLRAPVELPGEGPSVHGRAFLVGARRSLTPRIMYSSAVRR